MAENPIKVLHIDAGHEWRGGQQQVAYLLQNMIDAGYDTKLVCPAGSPLLQHSCEKNLPVASLLLTSKTRLNDARAIAMLCREEGFQIIHAHCSHSLTLAILSRLLYRNVRIVASRRVDFHVKKPIVGALKYRTKLLDKIICVSDAIREILIGDGVQPEKVVTVRSGIDLHKFDDANPQGLREEFSIPSDHVIILTVAALVGHKDYPTLLKAAQKVISKTEKVTFLAVGEGPKKEELLQLAAELNLGDRFIFTGHKNDVGRFLKLADIFVLASKTEGLGTSLLDAQVAGCAIVATEAGGIPEIVKDGETGLLAPPENAEALADGLLRIIEDKKERSRLAKNAQKEVEKFSHFNTFEKTDDVYQSL